jgi:hypothetical protein
MNDDTLEDVGLKFVAVPFKIIAESTAEHVFR